MRKLVAMVVVQARSLLRVITSTNTMMIICMKSGVKGKLVVCKEVGRYQRKILEGIISAKILHTLVARTGTETLRVQ